MNRPTWVTIVGVLVIIFGLLGVLNGAQQMIMPAIVDMQKEMIKAFEEMDIPPAESERDAGSGETKQADVNRQDVFRMFEFFHKQFEIPQWYREWAVGFGIVTMLISGLYLMSGIFLMMMKPYALRLFYISVAGSIVWALIEAAIFLNFGSGFVMLQASEFTASIIIDLVLIIVVAVAGKEGYASVDETE